MMVKRLTFRLLVASALLVMVYVIFTLPRLQPGKHQSRHHLYPHHISDQSITPVSDTKHFMVGAYKEHRVKGCSVRIISIFRQDSVQPLYCVFYCGTHWANGTMAEVQIHPEGFALGFAFVATDVLCPCPPGCNGSHVTIATQADAKLAQNHTFLRIQNLVKREEEERFQFNFTVCWSNLFDDYNNVLQVTQTLEMYKLLGVQQVVVYNTSCGPDLERLLQSYTQEGFVEVVPWPIDQHMNPSRGWLFNEHGGEIHYYGQLATLNDCVYRHMYQSRYVLLNDIDEIITPYQHQPLPQMMDALQRQHPKAGVFQIENHILAKSQYDLSGRYERPLWRDVPGSNILEHIYRQEPIDTKQQMKMIVQPRALEKTSVHSVLRNYGETVLVPPQLCRMLHIKFPIPGVSKEELHEDKRFWDYEIQLVPNVDKALERAGLLI